MAEDKKEMICKFLENNKGKKFSLKALNDSLSDISIVTVSKWTAVLIGEGRIKVDDYGNIKLVYVD